MAMINCQGISAGVDTIACISAATDYWIGYIIIILLTGIILFRFSDQPIKERMVVTGFVLAIITFLGSINNMLFPDQFFILSASLLLGSLFMLAIK